MATVDIIILQLFIIFLLAKIAAEIFAQLKLPPMVGEIFIGMFLGFYFLSTFDESMDILEVLSELGVIFLLFIIGMETRFSDLRKVGNEALSVGILGVILPFIFGFFVMFGYLYYLASVDDSLEFPPSFLVQMRESAHHLGEFPDRPGPIHLIGKPESGMLCLPQGPIVCFHCQAADVNGILGSGPPARGAWREEMNIGQPIFHRHGLG